MGLIKRLNLVLVEHDNAMREKERLQLRLNEMMGGTDTLSRKLDQQTSLKNVLNKNLQEDLRYEQEMGDKLKDEIQTLRYEGERLRGKLGDGDQMQKGFESETNQLGYNLRRKDDELMALEKENEHTQARKLRLEEDLDEARRRLLHKEDDAMHLRRQLEDVTAQRESLVNRLNMMTRDYEGFFANSQDAKDRQALESRFHMYRQCARKLFQTLDTAFSGTKLVGLNAIRKRADENVEGVKQLRRLFVILGKYALNKRAFYIRLWHYNALGWSKGHSQKQNLVLANQKSYLRRKYFALWRGVFHRFVKNVGHKGDSIRRLQSAVDKGDKIQKRQAFNIWSSRTQLSDVRTELMKNVFKLHYKKTLKRALIHWLGFTHDVTHRVRLETLSDLWTGWRAKQGVFLAWKESLAKQRFEKEEQVFRAWKAVLSSTGKQDYVERIEAMTKHVEKMKNKALVKKYWGILRKNAKHELYSGVFSELMEKERPAVQQARDELREFGEMEHRKQLQAVFHTLVKNFSNSLFSYFAQWRLETEHYKDMMQRVKMITIRSYKTQLTAAFSLWKRKCDKSRIADMTLAVDISAEEALKKQRDVFDQQHSLTAQDQREQEHRCRKAGEIMRKFGLRILKHRFSLWNFNVNRGAVLASATLKICGKLKKKIQREAFAKYRAKVQLMIREERLRRKLGDKLNGMDGRIKRRVFDSFKEFHVIWNKSKKYLRRVMLKSGQRMLLRGVNSWKAAMVKLSESQLREEQNRLQDQIDKLNLQEEQVNASILDASRRGGLLNTSMEKMGHRTLLKYLNKMCNKSLSHGFYYWRHLTEQCRRQEGIMRKYMMKLMNHFTIGAFQKWKDYSHAERRRDNAKRKKELEMELQRVKELAEREQRRNEEELANLDKQIHNVAEEGNRKAKQYNTAVQILLNRTDNNDYIDRRRLVLDSWKLSLKDQKQKLAQMARLAQKNLRTVFFRALNEKSRVDVFEERRMKTLKRFFLRFCMNVKRGAFSLWRQECSNSMVVELNDAVQTFNNEKQAHQEYQAVQRQVNEEKFSRVALNKRKRNILNQFRGICQFLKTLRNKKIALGQRVLNMRKKNALGDLGNRVVLSREQKWKRNKALIHLRSRSLFQLFTAWHDLLVKESLLPKKLNKGLNRLFQTDKAYAFGNIKDFVLSKGDRYRKFKHEGLRRLTLILDRSHERSMKEAFSTIVFRSLSWDQQVALQRGIFIRGMRRRLRKPFNLWKMKIEQMGIIRSINRESDVASNAYRARNKVVNMKRMMVSQGYHPDEVDTDVAELKRNLEKIMERAVKKLKMQANPDLWPLPKAMEAWKDYINLRKNIKFYADYVHKHLGMNLYQSAFLKWKQYRVCSQRPLEDMRKTDLARLCMDNERNVNIQSTFMDDQDLYLDDLNQQKIALFGRCIASRKMALTLPREKFDKAKELAFHRWKQAVHDNEVCYLTMHIKQQTALLEKMKDRYHSLEGDNNALVEDNEQLRQASLDGIEIAKAVQELTRQREQLSVDLVDRASSLKKLMEDNEKLRAAIRYKREEVEHITHVLLGQNRRLAVLQEVQDY